MSYIPASDSQYVLNASGTTINPATDETVQLLRRMVKLLDSIATVDAQNRQRVSLDAAPVAVTVVQATSSQLNGQVFQGTPSNLQTNTFIQQLGGVDPRFQFIDNARIAFATGIRNNLTY